MAEYPYDAENRLSTPHSYMYTPFEEADFFQAYADKRKAVIEACSADGVAERVPDFIKSGIDRCLDELVRAEGAFSLPENTVTSMRAMLSNVEWVTPVAAELHEPVDHFFSVPVVESLLALGENHDETQHQWLEWFIHRFEVAKCLRDEYNISAGRHGEKSVDLDLYVTFALLLVWKTYQRNDYKYLNALLKVCDLLCSVIGSEEAVDANRSLIAVVLVLERFVVFRECTRQGVA